jgi:hypothetical protein
MNRFEKILGPSGRLPVQVGVREGVRIFSRRLALLLAVFSGSTAVIGLMLWITATGGGLHGAALAVAAAIMALALAKVVSATRRLGDVATSRPTSPLAREQVEARDAAL